MYNSSDSLAKAMQATAHVRALLGVTEYHQAAGRQPEARNIAGGRELIEVVTGGRGWVEDEGGWVELVAGDICWHRQGDRTIGRSDVADPYRCLAVEVEVASLASRSVPHLTRWSDAEEVRWFTRQAVRWWLDDGFDRGALLAWVYGRLLFQATLDVHTRATRHLPPQLLAVIEALDMRYAEPLGLDELAAAAGWSGAHLHAVFREHLGTSPHQYLIQRRLRVARELLASTRQPIADVAAACGFSGAAAFCRTFRRGVGATPAAYRRRTAR